MKNHDIYCLKCKKRFKDLKEFGDHNKNCKSYGWQWVPARAVKAPIKTVHDAGIINHEPRSINKPGPTNLAQPTRNETLLKPDEVKKDEPKPEPTPEPVEETTAEAPKKRGRKPKNK